MSDIQVQTQYLKKQLNQLKTRYETSNPPDDIRDKAFFSYVKSETEPIYKSLETWETDVLDLVKKREVNLHPQQVTSTKENMEMLLLHSFYIDIMRKRYMSFYQSVLYIFDQLLNDVA